MTSSVAAWHGRCGPLPAHGYSSTDSWTDVVARHQVLRQQRGGADAQTVVSVKAALLSLSAVVVLALAPPRPAQAALLNTPDAEVPATNGAVHAIAVGPDRIYIGGSFTTVGGVARNRIAAIDRTSGELVASYNPGAGGVVYALAVSGSTLYVGGGFASIGGQARSGIAQLDAAGAPTAFNPSANQVVSALAVSGSTVFAGGRFTQIGGQPRNYIAQLDAAGTATAFDPDAELDVFALASSGTGVFAGGAFTVIGGRARTFFAQLNAAGAATTYDALADSNVSALAASGDTLYVGGDFSSIGGQVRHNIAQLAANGTATAFNPDADGSVVATAVSETRLFVSGGFTTIAGQSRSRLAELNADGTATGFNPGIAGGTPGGFQALATDGAGRLYVGCNCTSVGGRSTSFARFSEAPTAVTWRGGRARVRPTGGVVVSWRTGVSDATLGFDVLRMRRGSRAAVKVNRHLVRAASLSGRSAFSVRDRAGRAGDRYVVRSSGVDGARVKHPALTAHI